MGKEKGKGKERWKEDSLRNVGRTDARTQRQFYTLSNAMHSIGQTILILFAVFTSTCNSSIANTKT